MRGARIAEKIQEYISGGGQPPIQNIISSKQSSTYATNKNGSGSIIKQYTGKQQIKPNGIFSNNRTHTSHGNGMRVQSQGVKANQMNQSSDRNIEFKGRATSSYGSLQSRTNATMNQGAPVGTQFRQMQELNKSGISATSNVMLNNSRYTTQGNNYQESNTNTSQINL